MDRITYGYLYYDITQGDDKANVEKISSWIVAAAERRDHESLASYLERLEKNVPLPERDALIEQLWGAHHITSREPVPELDAALTEALVRRGSLPPATHLTHAALLEHLEWLKDWEEGRGVDFGPGFVVSPKPLARLARFESLDLDKGGRPDVDDVVGDLPSLRFVDLDGVEPDPILLTESVRTLYYTGAFARHAQVWKRLAEILGQLSVERAEGALEELNISEWSVSQLDPDEYPGSFDIIPRNRAGDAIYPSTSFHLDLLPPDPVGVYQLRVSQSASASDNTPSNPVLWNPVELNRWDDETWVHFPVISPAGPVDLMYSIERTVDGRGTSTYRLYVSMGNASERELLDERPLRFGYTTPPSVRSRAEKFAVDSMRDIAAEHYQTVVSQEELTQTEKTLPKRLAMSGFEQDISIPGYWVRWSLPIARPGTTWPASLSTGLRVLEGALTRDPEMLSMQMRGSEPTSYETLVSMALQGDRDAARAIDAETDTDRVLLWIAAEGPFDMLGDIGQRHALLQELEIFSAWSGMDVAMIKDIVAALHQSGDVVIWDGILDIASRDPTSSSILVSIAAVGAASLIIWGIKRWLS